MTSSLAKSKQIIGSQFQTLFSTVFLLFDVPGYPNTFDYIKDTRPAVYFNNQKILHIIFKSRTLQSGTVLCKLCCAVAAPSFVTG